MIFNFLFIFTNSIQVQNNCERQFDCKLENNSVHYILSEKGLNAINCSLKVKLDTGIIVSKVEMWILYSRLSHSKVFYIIKIKLKEEVQVCI